MSRVYEEGREQRAAERVQAILQRATAIREGHFAIGNRHSRTLVKKGALYTDPEGVREIAAFMAQIWLDELPEVLVGSGENGARLASAIAEAFLCDADLTVRTVTLTGDPEHLFPVYDDGPISLEQKRVLVIKDILATGETVRAMTEWVRTQEGNPMGVQTIWNHGGLVQADVGDVPIWALLEQPTEMWSADVCELCKKAVPLEDLKAVAA